jgi:imidazolonepropionase-like amidohydrolase
MTPKQAIQTSTLTELVGMADQIGTLEPGKLADVIFVPGDPLVDVTVLERVSKTWKGGMVAE